jgi:hypothetical protein
MVLLAVLLPGYSVQEAETAVLTLSCDGALSTFVGSTFIQGAVLAAAKSKPPGAIKKKKGEACPANTNDCHPQSWCCVKPSTCVIGGCSR